MFYNVEEALLVKDKLSYCLTCAGTGKRGNLSGKKKCKECKGSGMRPVKYESQDNAPVTTFDRITLPKIAGGFPPPIKLDKK